MNTRASCSHHLRGHAAAILTTCLATLLALPVRAAVEIPNVPLQSGSIVPPNILFILDDSGSMGWTFMPGAFGSNGVPATAPTDIKLETYARNTIYYNPAITYLPWRNADGSFRVSTPYSAVYSSTTLASGITTDLRSADRVFYVPKSGATDLSDSRQYLRYSLRSDANGGLIRRSERNALNNEINVTNLTSVTWDTPDGPVTRTVAQERANFANWFSYHRTRTKIAKAGTSYAFNDLGENIRVGFATIHQRDEYPIPVNQDLGLFRDNGGGFLFTNRSTWFDRVFAASASSGTPLRAALGRAGTYFSRADSLGPWGPGSGTSQLSCRQNFAILTTDGYWNSDTGPGGGDSEAGPVHTSTSGATYQYTPVRPYFTAGDAVGTLADVAMNYWKNDLRGDLPNNVPTSSANPAFWQHMVTFGISIGLQGTLNPDTAVSQPGPNNDLTDGGLNWPNPLTAENETRIDDLFHAAVNSRGTFVSATNPEQFTAGLRNALSTIVERTASSSNVSANSTSLNSGTRLFQASYVGGRWTGELAAFPVTAAGVGVTPAWRASTGIPATGRNVLTWNGTGGATFPTGAQTTALSANVAAYVRGQRTNEQQFGGSFRDRPHLLGDIVNSSPYFVKDTGTVYVGANAGMLHAFRASGSSTTDGQEIFAYVPGNISLPNLRTLANLDYPHHFFVDGPLVVSDRIQTPGKNYLVGALGRGGKGVYALDVTDPQTFNAANVMWDHNATNHSLMGNVLGRPIVARLNNGRTGVIVANGPNSTGNRAVLYVLDITNGSVLAEINTGVGSAAAPNGLMTPRGWDSDGDGTLDYVYAGDLLGNLWRFDLSSTNDAAWENAGNRLNMFTARDAANKPQPITGSPTLAIDPQSYKTWVFFGTGRFLNQSDLTRPDGSKNTDVQTWYGLIDGGANITGRAQLQQRSVVAATSIDGRPVRAFEAAGVLDTATKKGWYVDLVMPPSNTAEGERMIGDSSVIGTTLLAASIIPNADACEFGGRGFINAINAFTGTSVTQPFFDIDGDGQYGDDTVTHGGVPIPVGSVDLGIAMPTTPTVIENLLVAGGSLGTTGTVGINNPASQGRISWREIVGE